MTTKHKYITLTDENFQKEVIENAEPVLVDFCTRWSGSCHIMAPVINELAAEFEGRVKVGRLDIENNPQTAAAYGIQTVPAFLIFKNGQVVDQIAGLARNVELTEKLYALLQEK